MDVYVEIEELNALYDATKPSDEDNAQGHQAAGTWRAELSNTNAHWDVVGEDNKLVASYMTEHQARFIAANHNAHPEVMHQLLAGDKAAQAYSWHANECDRLNAELLGIKQNNEHTAQHDVEEIAGLRDELDRERVKVGLLMQPKPNDVEGSIWKLHQYWVANYGEEKQRWRKELTVLREKLKQTCVENTEFRRRLTIACEGCGADIVLSLKEGKEEDEWGAKCETCGWSGHD